MAEKFLDMAEKGMQKQKELADKAKQRLVDKAAEKKGGEKLKN